MPLRVRQPRPRRYQEQLTVFLPHDADFKLDIRNECEQRIRQYYRRDAKSGDENDEYVAGVLSIHCIDEQLLATEEGTWGSI